MRMHPTLALVTGASSGIGKALCYLLAEKKINLILSSRQSGPLELLRQELQSKVLIEIIQADLSKRDERQSLIQAMQLRGPDLVINNAGFGLYGECLTYPTDAQMNILEVNGAAALELSLEAARLLISEKRQGTIVNISSAAAFHIFPEMAVYAASKAFVNSFSQALNIELKPHGVCILTICPGMVETRFRERAGGLPQTESEKIGVMSPEFVAQEVWHQIQSQDSLRVIDWKYRFINLLSSFFPTHWRAAFLKKTINKRILPRKFISSKKDE